MRTRAGWAGSTSLDTIADYTLRGLDPLLNLLPTLDAERASRTAALLWEALGEMVDRRGAGAFLGTYNWFYFQTRSCVFDAVFVKRLNETAWVPDRNGAIHPPSSVVFEETGWKLNPFLLSKLQFKPPILEALAREAGIEPGLLELLKKLGVTSEAQLKTRLGINEDQAGEGEHGTESVGDALKKLLGDAPKPTPPVPDPAGPEPTGTGGGGTGASGSGGGAPSTHGGSGSPAAGSNGGGKASGTGNGQHAHKAGSSGARPFYSYVGTHPDDEEPDPDGLDQQARLALEEKAIALIIAQEPELRRMPTNNEGFDLVELGPDGTTVRWIEVKAMTGDLKSRPVGVSRSQFKSAQEHGDNYWLYVVERAGLPEEARLVRIQDPSGKARTFTFDHGWLQIAQINQPDHLDQQEQSDEE